MKRKHTMIRIVLLLAVLDVVVAGRAHAAYILDAGQLDFGPNYAEFIDYYDYEDNDDNVSMTLQEAFEQVDDGEEAEFNWGIIAKEYETLDPIDLYFEVENSEGTTEYLFVEPVFNFTGVDWADYHLQLGLVGPEEEFVPLDDLVFDYDYEEIFRISEVIDEGDATLEEIQEYIEENDDVFLGTQLGLDFDTPDKDPTPSAFYLLEEEEGYSMLPIFNTVSHLDDRIWFEDPIDNGILSFGEEDDPEYEDAAFITFSIDVPDEDFFFEGGYEFALRQYPTIDIREDKGVNAIPVPSSVLLLSIGLLSCAGARRRKT